MNTKIHDSEIISKFGAPKSFRSISIFLFTLALFSSASLIYTHYQGMADYSIVSLAATSTFFTIAMVLFAINKSSYHHKITINRISKDIVIEEDERQAHIPLSNISHVEICREIKFTSNDVGNHRKVIRYEIRFARHYGSAIFFWTAGKVNYELIEAIRKFTELPIKAYAKADKGKEQEFLEKMKEINIEVFNSRPELPNYQELEKGLETRYQVQPLPNTTYIHSQSGRELQWKTDPLSIAALVISGIFAGSIAFYLYPHFSAYILTALGLIFFLIAATQALRVNKLKFDLGDLSFIIQGIRGETVWSKVDFSNIKSFAGDINGGKSRGLIIKKVSASQDLPRKNLWRLLNKIGEDYEFFQLESLKILEKLEIESMILDKIVR